MKKKSKSIFLKGFLKSLLYIGAFVILFLVSYELTGLYLGREHTKSPDTNKINMELEGSVDATAFNLIFSVNESSNELEHVVLEILNTKTDCLMYVTIPINAKFAMSTELYKEVFEKNADIPQILSFEAFRENVNASEYYDFGTKLLEDSLDVPISYYTIVPADIFDEIFTEDEDILVLSQDMQAMLNGYTEQNIIDYLTDFYNSTNCNLSLNDRLTYTPALSKVSLENVIYTVLPGKADGSTDMEKTAELWNAMKEDYTIEAVQGLVGSGKQVSLEKNIRVLNGSGITGLASNVQAELVEAGYTVTGIANYTSSDVESTIIQVNEEGLGTDLVSYFHTADVEINEDMPYGVDIQIILGKSESMS